MRGSDTSEDLSRHYEDCGRIFWLWSNSRLHKTWPVGLQTRFVLPAVLYRQYCILERAGVPRAYCSWAWLNLETEAKYVLNPNTLEPDDWAAGDRLWFIDWIAPFSARDTRALRAQMAEKFPQEVARALRVKPGQSATRIATFSGSSLTRDEAKKTRARLYMELSQKLKTHPDQGVTFLIR